MTDYDDDWILFRLQRLKPTRFEELPEGASIRIAAEARWSRRDS